MARRDGYWPKVSTGLPAKAVQGARLVNKALPVEGGGLNGLLLTHPRGEVSFTSPGTTVTWKVPFGVQEVSVVVVGGQTASGTSHFNNQVIATGGNLAGVGGTYSGADGGANGGSGGSSYQNKGGGGGGAAGYLSNGGNGGNASTAGGYTSSGGYGGGVGLFGGSAGGTGGQAGSASDGNNGTPGSGGVGQSYGGGGGGAAGGGGNGGDGYGGGGLGWKNNIKVRSGQLIQIGVGGTNGAVRVIWGPGRSFPSNAA